MSARRAARTYSLSGLVRCGHCGGALHFYTRPNGVVAVHCFQKRQTGGHKCDQRETPLGPIEEQISTFLWGFRLPSDTVARVMKMHESAAEEQIDGERQRRDLTSRLERLADMYKWGDITTDAYRAEWGQGQR